jgi:hypothetical protein
MKVQIPISDELRIHWFSKCIRMEIDKEILYGLDKVPDSDAQDTWAWLTDDQEQWILDHDVQVVIMEGDQGITLEFSDDSQAMEFCLKFL